MSRNPSLSLTATLAMCTLALMAMLPLCASQLQKQQVTKLKYVEEFARPPVTAEGFRNPADYPVVMTSSGPVRGFIDQDTSVQMFLGIPFATPPTGNMRFRPPIPPTPWNDTRDALEYGQVCPQVGKLIGDLFIGHEDCLYLNVFVPPNATGPLPVMFWIYGGGYILGDSHELGLYDARHLVSKRNVVLVSVNYRLGPFGFLATEELLAESGTTGNYGVQDQRLGLQWVRFVGGGVDSLLRVDVLCFSLMMGDCFVCVSGLFFRCMTTSPTLVATHRASQSLARVLGESLMVQGTRTTATATSTSTSTNTSTHTNSHISAPLSPLRRAFSVCWHLVNSLSGGLFSAAIMESGTCDSPDFFQALPTATHLGDVYSDASGCNATLLGPTEFLKCLRDLSTADVLTSVWDMLFDDNWPYKQTSASSLADKQVERPWLYGTTAFQVLRSRASRQQAQAVQDVPGLPKVAPLMPWGPAIDGTATGLLETPLSLMQKGQFNRVPLIIGTNNDEGSIFIPAVGMIVRHVHLPLNDSSFMQVMEHFFNTSAVLQVADIYPNYEFKNDDDRAARVLRDFFFTCATRRVARALDRFSVPVYVYHFTYKGDWIEDPFLGDYHSAELCFVFDNEWPPLIHIFSEKDQQMADSFGTFWTNFAKFHDPNGDSTLPRAAGDVFWPKYNSTVELNAVMDVPVSVEEAFEDEQCEFWDMVSELP